MNLYIIRLVGLLLTVVLMAACSTVDDGEGLQSALDVQPQVQAKPYALTRLNNDENQQADASQQQTSQINQYNDPAINQESVVSLAQANAPELADGSRPLQAPNTQTNTNFVTNNTNPARPATGPVRQKPGSDFAATTTPLIPLEPRASKTYLINGLASSVKVIGYGFTNLAKKIPNSELYNYASFIESSTVIRSRITKDIKAVYRNNPDTDINMIGISFGANIVTLIAADLNRAGIPVNYLVTMDGPAMVPIRKNVRIVDNFTCSGFNCFRTKSRLAGSNRKTDYSTFTISSSHIPLADHNKVHARILSQLNASRFRPIYAVAQQ